MYGNAVGAKAFAVQGHLQHIWQVPSAGIAQRCHFIDIYTQVYHNNFLALLINITCCFRRLVRSYEQKLLYLSANIVTKVKVIAEK